MRGSRVETRVLVAVVLALAAALAVPALAEEHAKDRGAEGGMRVYIDPATGERTSAPPVAAAQPAGAGASAAPAAGLVEEVNPQGGYVINLQRRFRGAMAVRADAAGEVSVECETGATAVGQ